MADQWTPPVHREEIFGWTGLSTDELRDMILAVARACGFRVVRVTDTKWPEGHPDRVTFEVEEI